MGCIKLLAQTKHSAFLVARMGSSLCVLPSHVFFTCQLWPQLQYTGNKKYMKAAKQQVQIYQGKITSWKFKENPLVIVAKDLLPVASRWPNNNNLHLVHLVECKSQWKQYCTNNLRQGLAFSVLVTPTHSPLEVVSTCPGCVPPLVQFRLGLSQSPLWRQDHHPIEHNTKMLWRKPNWTWLNLVSKDKMSKWVPVNGHFFGKNPWSAMREVWWSENGSCLDTKTCRRSVKLYRTCSRSWYKLACLWAHQNMSRGRIWLQAEATATHFSLCFALSSTLFRVSRPPQLTFSERLLQGDSIKNTCLAL